MRAEFSIDTTLFGGLKGRRLAMRLTARRNDLSSLSEGARTYQLAIFQLGEGIFCPGGISVNSVGGLFTRVGVFHLSGGLVHPSGDSFTPVEGHFTPVQELSPQWRR
jgi:hypothetical protein